MKNKQQKILIAGVGGQGIVYLTNIIAEAARLSNIAVCVSEIHGLSQRGGVVTAGIGLGKHCTGFAGNANVDFLIGLEPLETQRCLQHLHTNSSVIFSNYRIAPYSVNSEMSTYPDVITFIEFIQKQVKEVVFINNYPAEITSVLYNVFLLGVATNMKDFPFDKKILKEAIKNTVMDFHLEKTLYAFQKGLEYEWKTQTA